MNYQVYMARQMTTGDDFDFKGVKWVCVESCTIIGCTIEGNIPVIKGPDGPMLNQNHLLERGFFKTLPKPGQTRTEIMTLAEYEHVEPKELEGKELKRVYKMDEKFIAVCHDKTYVKFIATTWNIDLTLDSECLTLDELNRLNLIPESTWQQHLEEERKTRAENTARLYDTQFKEAARRVGKERAKKLLGFS